MRLRALTTITGRVAQSYPAGIRPGDEFDIEDDLGERLIRLKAAERVGVVAKAKAAAKRKPAG